MPEATLATYLCGKLLQDDRAMREKGQKQGSMVILSLQPNRVWHMLCAVLVIVLVMASQTRLPQTCIKPQETVGEGICSL